MISISCTAPQFHHFFAIDPSPKKKKKRAAGFGRLRFTGNISQYSFYAIDDILKVTKPVIPKLWL